MFLNDTRFLLKGFIECQAFPLQSHQIHQEYLQQSENQHDGLGRLKIGEWQSMIKTIAVSHKRVYRYW